MFPLSRRTCRVKLNVTEVIARSGNSTRPPKAAAGTSADETRAKKESTTAWGVIGRPTSGRATAQRALAMSVTRLGLARSVCVSLVLVTYCTVYLCETEMSDGAHL